MKGDDRNKREKRCMGYHYWIPTAVLTLGALATAMLLWIYQIGERQRLNYQHIDAVMDLQIEASGFHLRLKEAFIGGIGTEPEKALRDLDAAMQLAHALLHGGTSERGTPLPPLDTPRFRERVEAIGSRLAELKEIAFKSYEDPKAGGIGSPLDQQFNNVFDEFRNSARALESLAEETQAGDYARSRHLFFATIVTWAVIVATSTLGFYNRELRRRRAELALETAYEEMEQRVRDRTYELEDANNHLQEEIAERGRVEESLRESARGFRKLSVQFKTLLDSLPDSITLLSRDLEVLWSNRGVHALTLTGVAGPPGKRCHTLWNRGSKPCEDCPVVRSFLTGKAADARISWGDGRHWELRAVPIWSENGAMESVLKLATDVTDKVMHQAETMRAAHLASLGELSAGVAHEINNPINGIINCAQIIYDQSPAGNKIHGTATRILKEGNRIGDIVRGLLTFARDRKDEKVPAAVEQILSESLALTRSQMSKEGILLLNEVSSDLPEIVANPQQIQQVFMNIISNARYALNRKYPGPHEDKILEIRGERISISGKIHVRVTFHDHGTGIPAHLMDKLMEPFFSTKPTGKGTGLGLSISHGIVSDHGGRLAVESVEEEFTRVMIDLPAKENGQWRGSS